MYEIYEDPFLLALGKEGMSPCTISRTLASSAGRASSSSSWACRAFQMGGASDFRALRSVSTFSCHRVGGLMSEWEERA